MPRIVKYSRRVMAALAMVLIPAGALATMATADQPIEPVRCEIRTTPESSMVTLEALAHAHRNVSGTYSFHVEGAGRSGGTNIVQGGAFSAAPGKPATLGAVTLDANGAVYDAKLEVTVDGKSVGCAKRVGGAT
ncbi:curli-like amyloid fiber formation chaperone CsgH [Mesorhizobium carmichaelinearum]|uniref:curli-like amyloid fiber formation chaperone CsgH n=1 Tax=Mesorhizobium carmichaelinearum TaxID=1208188 RepID=UPI0011805917|nr:curli-like amyloid fiber formation chaperone CsgH [Mesorhizobium carmichaelinearum]